MTTLREKQEMQAERRAAIEVGSTSFTDCLRVNGLEIEWPSFETKKGVQKGAKVRGQDIRDNETWNKFLAHVSKVDTHLTSLSEVDSLTELYDTFFETSHTERHRNLDTEGQQWRRKVVRLAVTYHIMDNKIDGYLQGQDTFADERVAYYWTLVRTIRTAMAGAARVIHHIIEDEEKAQFYLKEFFTAHYEQFRAIPFPQRDDILRLVAPKDNEEDIAV